MDFFEKLPQQVRNFLSHKLTIEGKSKLTVKEYAYDLQTFFRFMVRRLNKEYGALKDKSEFVKGDLSQIDVEFIKRITLTDIYEFLMFLHNEMGNSVKARARKLCSLRSFYKYLTVKAHILETDIVKDVEIPKIGKALPRYLQLEESKTLLNSIEGKNKERDFLMLMILLNCGLRVSELRNIKLNDIKGDVLRVTGKGSKERQLYLNDATQSAVSDYLMVRQDVNDNQLFLSATGKPISVAGIQHTVKNQFRKAGFDATKLSTHKLRHTAATLMYKYGDIDIKTLQAVLGHENLNTTEIYTHTDNEQIKDAINKNPLSDFKKSGE